MNIIAEVRGAFAAAVAKPDEGEIPGRVHRARSRNFVEALADRLRLAYGHDPTVAVFSKHFDRHRERFGLNELLFDILVCRTSTTTSANSSQELTFVTGCILAVESEFARDSRQAMYDFNKLVLCASDKKLFIGPRGGDEAAFLEPLGKAAAYCGGSVFVALVPHPDTWRAAQQPDVSGYRWDGLRWAA